MLWMIADIFILIFETWLLLFLAKHFLSNQQKRGFRMLIYLILFLLFHRLTVTLFVGHVALTAFFSGLTDYILLGLLWPGQWRKRLFTVFFYYALMISLDLFLIFALPIRIDSLYLERYQMLCMIASRSLLLLILLAAARLGGEEAKPRNYTIYIAPLPALISAALLISLYGYEVYDVAFNQRLNIAVTMVLLVILVLLFAYIQLMQNEKTLQNRLQAQEILRREQEHYCDAALKSYHTIRRTRHDLHHYIDAVSTLIQTGQYEQALEICNSASQRIRTPLIFTGNETVDAILYSKQVLFQQTEVTLAIEGLLPKELDYDSADICTILSNALENALEAVRNLPPEDRTVSVRFVFDEWLLLIVENKLETSLAFHQRRLLSGKSGQGHGIGLDSIESACKRQGGYLETTITPEKFILSATLQPRDKHVK